VNADRWSELVECVETGCRNMECADKSAICACVSSLFEGAVFGECVEFASSETSEVEPAGLAGLDREMRDTAHVAAEASAAVTDDDCAVSAGDDSETAVSAVGVDSGRSTTEDVLELDRSEWCGE